MYSSRDFTLYISNFDLNNQNYSEIFATFIDKKYLTIHNFILELNNFLQVQQYDQYGRKLNQLFRTIFGNKTIKEDLWTKTVNNLEHYNPN